MNVIVDTNVMLDVFLKRQPHYAASAAIMSAVATGVLKGYCPSHELTTLYYLADKFASKSDAEFAVDEVLKDFQIISLEKSEWKQARVLSMSDFEDAGVAITAQKAGAAFIITRNEADFVGSPVPAILPATFLSRFMPQT